MRDVDRHELLSVWLDVVRCSEWELIFGDYDRRNVTVTTA